MKKGVKLPLWGGIALAAGLCALVACALLRNGADRPPAAAVDARPVDVSKINGEEVELLVTGYCNCGKCCGWRKRWYLFGEPVYNYGKMAGMPKKVGVTASGSVAGLGTVAADPSVYPFGTELAIPGYGMAVVQDVGGAIKGTHIDLWFPSHEQARAWGTRTLKVKIVSRRKPKKPQAKH